jgi:hypothetical protein
MEMILNKDGFTKGRRVIHNAKVDIVAKHIAYLIRLGAPVDSEELRHVETMVKSLRISE